MQLELKQADTPPRFSRYVKEHWELLLLAAVGFSIVVARVITQSVTVDEADTFLIFVWRSQPLYWFTSPNNHVLNTILESLSVRLFGPSQVTIRLPATLGALIYITCCLKLCERYVRGRVLASASLACLLLNPFVLDYLVAARGYSLALAFLMSGIYLLATGLQISTQRLPRMFAASIAMGLSISANFSFGIIDVVTLMVFAYTYLADKRGPHRLALIAVTLAPVTIVAISLCGSALIGFRSSELVTGASSIGEMLRSIPVDTFDGPNSDYVNYVVASALGPLRQVLPVVVLALLIAIILMLLLRPRGSAKSLALLTVVSLFSSFLIEIGLFSILHGPLPVDRTLVFASPLITLIICTSVADLRSKVLAGFCTLTLAISAIFFVSSIRDYFREWKFDANASQVYAALLAVEKRSPELSVGATSGLVSSINFYSTIDKGSKVPHLNLDLKTPNFIPRGRSVYALFSGVDDDFVKSEHLSVIYSIPGDHFPDAVIAVRDNAEPLASMALHHVR